MSFNFEVEAGKSVRLTTAGKYCDRDIVVASNGYTEADMQAKYDEGAVSTIKKMNSINYLFSNQHNRELFDFFMSADLSKITSAQYVFLDNNWLTEFSVPGTFRPTVIHGLLQKCTNLKRVSGMHNISVVVLSDVFEGCSSLEDAGAVNFTGVEYVARTFRNCTALKHITAAGTVSVSGMDLQWSTQLSRASIESIINALSTTTSGLSITLSQTAVSAAFTDEEWATLANTRSNWTINLV